MFLSQTTEFAGRLMVSTNLSWSCSQGWWTWM